MAVSVRMDPLLEQELELAAKRKGVTKSQFIIDAVERALGRKNAFQLLNALQVEEERAEYKVVAKAFQGQEQAYETDASRELLLQKLQGKHGSSAD
jgi:predicted DNA-binding protein